MISVEVLVEGYARCIPDGWDSLATTTLIRTDGHVIVVDPGPAYQRVRQAMRRHGVEEHECTVFVTHFHFDHIAGMTAVPHLAVVDGTYVYAGAISRRHDGAPFGKAIELLSTPGHTAEHTSLLVHADDACYAIAGDVIWHEAASEEAILRAPDPFAEDMDILVESRKQLLARADVIVPGHGPSFTVP